jgi:arsenate reductase (thioredoxin)
MNVLFLCTGNSCRSQMAEGYARALWGKHHEAQSAGTEPHGMNPFTVKVMTEDGVDISGHWSKSVDDVDLENIDLVVSVCDDARESCPVLPGTTRRLHRSFRDPFVLGRGLPEELALEEYRRIRDEIKVWIMELERELDAIAQA